MNAFSYETRAVRVTLRPGAAGELAAELSRFGWQRPLLVTTPGRASMARALASSLTSVVGVYDGARMHVPEEVVEDAAADASRLNADALIAIGGGSAIGAAKAVALRTGLPILAVPTTYAGSEMTSIWGTTVGGEKKTGRDERVAPRGVVYDPLLTLGLDAPTSATSGVNAIAHCVEALYAPNANPIASLLAAEGIGVMARSLRAIVRDPHDVEARSGAMYAAHLAGRALDMTRMGLQHGLCHVLGGTFGLPHALTHAVVLPHVVAFNTPAATEAVAVVAAALARVEPAAAGRVGEPRGAAGPGDAARALHGLNVELGIAATLEDIGFNATDIERAVHAVVQAGYPNPRPVTTEGVKMILESALRGYAPGSFTGEG